MFFVDYVPAEEDIAVLSLGKETDIDCEEPELDSIEMTKFDLPKNIIKNMEDLTFIQPDVNSMLNFWSFSFFIV